VNLDGRSDTDKVAAANLVAGTGAMIGGLYRLLTPEPVGPKRLAWQVIPSSGGPRLGLAVHTTF
jgi:hypothetical protein